MTPWFLHALRGNLPRDLIPERPMRPLGIAVTDPATYRLTCMANRLEPVLR